MKGGLLTVTVSGTLATALAAPVSAQDALVLQPSGDWTLDYAEDSCALRRTFGSDAARVDLEMLQQAPGAYFRVTVTSATLGLAQSKAKVRFEPDNRPQVPAYLVPGRLGETTSIAFTDSLQTNTMGQPYPYVGWNDDGRERRERSITALSIESGFDRNLTLETGEMHAPMEALRACMFDLYATWGVDLRTHESLSSPAQWQNLGQVSRQVRQLVPSDFFRSKIDVPGIIRLIVGPDGRAKRCRVHFGEWPDAVSDEMCVLVTREARFFPARDRSRKPVTSYQILEIER